MSNCQRGRRAPIPESSLLPAGLLEESRRDEFQKFVWGLQRGFRLGQLNCIHPAPRNLLKIGKVQTWSVTYSRQAQLRSCRLLDVSCEFFEKACVSLGKCL